MSHKGHYEPRRRARRRALQALYQWEITAQEANDILAQFREAQDLSGVDEEHFEALIRGVIRDQPELDAALSEYLDRPLEQLDLMERVVLRMGAWELLHLPELPFRIVLDECVDLERRFGSEQGHAYVNAVLDRAVRDWRPHETGTEAGG